MDKWHNDSIVRRGWKEDLGARTNQQAVSTTGKETHTTCKGIL